MKLPAWQNMSGTSMESAKRKPQLQEYAPRLQAFTVDARAAATRNVSLIGQAGRAQQEAYGNIGKAVNAGINLGANIYRTESDIDAEKAYIDYAEKAAGVSTDIKTAPNVIETYDADGNVVSREETWKDAPKKYQKEADKIASELEDLGSLRTQRAKRLFNLKRQAFDTRINKDMAMYEQTQWVSREKGELEIALQKAPDERTVRDLISKGYDGKILTGEEAAQKSIYHVARVYNEQLTTQITAAEQYLLSPSATLGDVDRMFLALRAQVQEENLPITSEQRNAHLNRLASSHATWDSKIKSRVQGMNYVNDVKALWLADRNTPEGSEQVARIERRMSSPGAFDYYGRENWSAIQRDMEALQTKGQDKIDVITGVEDHIARWWISADGQFPAYDNNGVLRGPEDYKDVDHMEVLDYIRSIPTHEMSAVKRSSLLDRVTRLHQQKTREDVQGALTLIREYYNPSVHPTWDKARLGRERGNAMLTIEDALLRNPNQNPREIAIKYIGSKETLPEWAVGSSSIDKSKPMTIFDVDVDATKSAIRVWHEAEMARIMEKEKTWTGDDKSLEINELKKQYDLRMRAIDNIDKAQYLRKGEYLDTRYK